MQTITLKYLDSLGAIQTRAIKYLSVRGFDDPDSISLWPPVLYELADGSKRTEFKGFRRIITIDFGVLQDIADHSFLLSFLKSNTRSVYYNSTGVGAEEIFVTSDASFESQWIDGCKLRKHFVLPLTENVIRTTWTSYNPPSTVDIMYIKNKVEITGTQASPETFTTNAGKLATDETGQVYPGMSLLSYAVTVMCNSTPYQDAKINLVGSVANSGSDLTFQLAISDGGAASGDGKYYADIIIGLQARP